MWPLRALAWLLHHQMLWLGECLWMSLSVSWFFVLGLLLDWPAKLIALFPAACHCIHCLRLIFWSWERAVACFYLFYLHYSYASTTRSAFLSFKQLRLCTGDFHAQWVIFIVIIVNSGWLLYEVFDWHACCEGSYACNLLWKSWEKFGFCLQFTNFEQVIVCFQTNMGASWFINHVYHHWKQDPPST